MQKGSKSQQKFYTFIWSGLNDRGHKVEGVIEGRSPAFVKATLHSKKIIAHKIRKKGNPLFIRKKRITPKDIAIFTRQLATMITSGIPLVQSFDIVGKGHPNPEMGKVIMSLKKDVEEGRTLVDALKKHPAHFNTLYCSLVETGEQSGALDSILERLATHKEKSESIKGKIKKALFYPIAVIIVAILVTAAILLYVVPQFQELFQSFGADLPLMTQIVIKMSEFIQAWWWAILAIIIMISAGIGYLYKHNVRFIRMVQRLSLKIPVIGPILSKAAIARFARTLATTFAAGVPLVEALKTVGSATGNMMYNEAVQDISHDIAQGQHLEHAMRERKIFPDMVTQMVSIGEESGELENMLTKVAEFYEDEVDNAVDGLSSLIEPIIMAVLGVLIGGLIIAMYLPIFKLGSVV